MVALVSSPSVSPRLSTNWLGPPLIISPPNAINAIARSSSTHNIPSSKVFSPYKREVLSLISGEWILGILKDHEKHLVHPKVDTNPPPAEVDEVWGIPLSLLEEYILSLFKTLQILTVEDSSYHIREPSSLELTSDESNVSMVHIAMTFGILWTTETPR